jgi:hypothetical protein
MELNRSSEAASCAATEKLPCILWNPKVQYRVHNGTPLVPMLDHDSVHFLDPCTIYPIDLFPLFKL